MMKIIKKQRKKKAKKEKQKKLKKKEKARRKENQIKGIVDSFFYLNCGEYYVIWG